MRYYVIINGISSLTIKGLAIKSLPAITKAPLRTLNETIDGRDGDLITPLGYGAYDKTIEIGLFGSYDIDEVIAYFNQEGTIVFSDEDDKVYNFKIINQIDYNKLVAFRSATITLHIQPFKYSLTEEPYEVEYEYVEDEGENLTLNNTEGNAKLTLTLKGNTTQNGTPTPSSPINVNVVSGDNILKVGGKNLLKLDFVTERPTFAGLTFTHTDSTFTLNGTTTGTWTIFNLKEKPNIENGKTYTFSANITGTNPSMIISCYLWNKSSQQIDNIRMSSNNNYNLTKTINFNGPTDLVYDYATFVIEGLTNNSAYNLSAEIQLELSNEKTTFEPYQSQTYPIKLGDIELNKISTYQDYIYKDSGKWYLHKEIRKVVLDGSNIGIRSTYSNIDYAVIPKPTDFLGYNTWDKVTIICESATYISETAGSWDTANNISKISGNAVEKNWWLGFTKGTTQATMQTQLNGKNIYYPLSTPTNTEITNTTLINNLNELEKAKSYEGTTNIGQVNNDLGFIISASTLKKGTNETIVNNEGNIYSKPIIELEGNGSIDIYLNGTQVFQVDTTDVNEITIDSENMEAYETGTTNLANRKVIGDYETFKVPSGNNTIKFEGALTKATISKVSRWL